MWIWGITTDSIQKKEVATITLYTGLVSTFLSSTFFVFFGVISEDIQIRAQSA